MIEREIVDGLTAEDRLMAVFEEMTACLDDDAVDDAPAESDDSAAEEDECEWAEMVRLSAPSHPMYYAW